MQDAVYRKWLLNDQDRGLWVPTHVYEFGGACSRTQFRAATDSRGLLCHYTCRSSSLWMLTLQHLSRLPEKLQIVWIRQTEGPGTSDTPGYAFSLWPMAGVFEDTRGMLGPLAL